MAKGSENPPGAKRHRTKFQLESIHVDELLTAAGMSGYLSVLEPPAGSPPPHLERLAEEMLAEYQASGKAVPERYEDALSERKVGVPETGIPSSGTPVTGTPVSVRSAEVAVAGFPAPVVSSGRRSLKTGIPETGIPPSGTTHSGVPVSSQVSFLRTPTIRQASLVQDGHSFGEQAVYQALWDHAQPYDAESRIIGIGYRTLSQICRLTVNNCKANLLSLCRKLALKELAGHGPTQAKTYQVFGYNAILRQRRQAGLTHYIKTRGVSFVDPQTGQGIHDLGIPVSGIPVSKSGTPETGIPTSETGIPESGDAGIPVSATPSLEHLIRHPFVSSSSTLPHGIVRQAMEEVAGPVDDDAVLRLVYACTTLAPDIIEQEIAALVRLKGSLISSHRIHNPVGFLLITVPKIVAGDGLERFRAWYTLREPTAPALLKSDLVRLAEDPSATEEDRAFAHRVLAQLGEA